MDAYGICLICGLEIFDFEIERGEAFFKAFQNLGPPHHNDCLLRVDDKLDSLLNTLRNGELQRLLDLTNKEIAEKGRQIDELIKIRRAKVEEIRKVSENVTVADYPIDLPPAKDYLGDFLKGLDALDPVYVKNALTMAYDPAYKNWKKEFQGYIASEKTLENDILFLKNRASLLKKGGIAMSSPHNDVIVNTEPLLVLPCNYEFRRYLAVPPFAFRWNVESSLERAVIQKAAQQEDGQFKNPISVVFLPLKNPENWKEPQISDFYSHGTLAEITVEQYMQGAGLPVVISHQKKVKVLWRTAEFHSGVDIILVENLADVDFQNKNVMAKIEQLAETIRNICSLNAGYLSPVIGDFAQNPAGLLKAEALDALFNTLAFDAGLGTTWESLLWPYRYELFKKSSLAERLDEALKLVKVFLAHAEVVKSCQNTLEKTQQDVERETAIRNQIALLQNELGGQDSEDEIAEWKRQIQELEAIQPPLSELVIKEAKKQLRKLGRCRPDDATYSKIAGWLADHFLVLPWNKRTPDNFDIVQARKILDEDHYGLKHVKKRIIGHLAVLKRKEEQRKLVQEGKLELKDEQKRRTVLCFVGPPGVAKTALGIPIARALGRRFYCTSFGGVEDEHEISGFMETYVGSMAGRIIQGMIQAGSKNPVFMIDEIDKMKKVRGNPESVFLAVLDSTLKDGFVDNYMRIPFDLSEVLFITTANSVDEIIPALRDRMEIIKFSGYTVGEKFEIAKRHLIPKTLEYHFLSSELVEFSDEAIQDIIEYYINEAGVRKLGEKIARICQEICSEENTGKINITRENLSKYLGPRMNVEEVIKGRVSEPGVAVGLAWDEQGGSILFVEVGRRLKPRLSEEQIIVTGSIKDVMKESAKVALTRVWEFAEKKGQKYGLDKKKLEKDLQKYQLHLNIGPLSVPKEGPSATITIFVALVSYLSGRCINRKVAMTGEMNLRGLILPVGGFEAKFNAAHRAKIERVLYPAVQQAEVEDILSKYPDLKKGITYIPVSTDEEVLKNALEPDDPEIGP